MKSILLVGLYVNMLAMIVAEHSSGRVRHSYLRNSHERQERRQWQPTNYRSYEPNYQQYHHEYTINRQAALTEEIINMLRELKDLSTQKERPYYQPIYVPYPVPLSIPSSTSKLNAVKNKPIPALPSRINFADDDKDYVRPIMLKPVTEAPSTTTTAKISDSESAIVFKPDSQDNVRKPSRCETAILLCCRFTQPDKAKMCFSQNGCSKTYATKLACDKRVIQIVIQSFADTYGPK